METEVLPFEPTTGVPMIIYWLVSFLFCIILIDAKMMTRKVTIAIYLITIIGGGILLGGIPNAVVPIQQFLITLGVQGDLGYLLPAILVLGILLGSSLLVGRIFCGFACPLGALQELLSKINFKSDLKANKESKYRIEVSSQVPTLIRWGFFGVLLFLTLESIVILPVFNPMSGFSFFQTPFAPTVVIPFVGLIVVGITSVFLYRPWCRFLCPFGAGSSLCSQFAGTKYQRTDDCTECGACEEICPTQEASIDSKKAECYYCNRCVEVCPENAIVFNLG
ncbi:MAG: 4Fe-4S binding protein [Candidatus Heimdallarchaeota archaeon]|nr:MAG: 4Fe-4S binding protein [Candidatus Heimdallarchaeota archaeon]